MSRARWFSLAIGSIWSLYLLYFHVCVLTLALTLAFAIPAQLLATIFVIKQSFILALAIQQLGSFIAGVLAAPIAPIAVSLVYYDQRVRKEAFDLQLMMQSIDQAAPVQTAIAAPPIG